MLKNGFTLIELVIVIVILGVIAAIAAPRFSSAATQSKYAATHSGFRNLASAIDTYYAEHLSYPPNAAIRTRPPEFADYVPESSFTTSPPLGRAWNWNGAGSSVDNFGVNLSIHTTTAVDRAEMETRFDDGDPATGIYRNETHYLLWPFEN